MSLAGEGGVSERVWRHGNREREAKTLQKYSS